MRRLLLLSLAAGALAQQNPPAVPNLSQRASGSSLGTIRVGAADNNIWFGWKVAIPAPHFRSSTFSEVLPKADLLTVTGIEMTNTQRTSVEVPKPFDYRLQTGERNAVVRRLREYNQSVMAYRVDNLGDEATRAQVLRICEGGQHPPDRHVDGRCRRSINSPTSSISM